MSNANTINFLFRWFYLQRCKSRFVRKVLDSDESQIQRTLRDFGEQAVEAGFPLDKTRRALGSAVKLAEQKTKIAVPSWQHNFYVGCVFNKNLCECLDKVITQPQSDVCDSDVIDGLCVAFEYESGALRRMAPHTGLMMRKLVRNFSTGAKVMGVPSHKIKQMQKEAVKKIAGYIKQEEDKVIHKIKKTYSNDIVPWQDFWRRTWEYHNFIERCTAKMKQILDDMDKPKRKKRRLYRDFTPLQLRAEHQGTALPQLRARHQDDLSSSYSHSLPQQKTKKKKHKRSHKGDFTQPQMGDEYLDDLHYPTL